jgi:hypothetical protein
MPVAHPLSECQDPVGILIGQEEPPWADSKDAAP